MAGSLNRITIIGNVGRDPESRTTSSEMALTTFSVAVNERRRDSSGAMQDKTLWFRVSAFGRLAEICAQYLTKGSSVYVEGRLDPQEWTDASGTQRTTMGIVANDIRMLDGRDALAEGEQHGSRSESIQREPVAVGDLPF